MNDLDPRRNKNESHLEHAIFFEVGRKKILVIWMWSPINAMQNRSPERGEKAHAVAQVAGG